MSVVRIQPATAAAVALMLALPGLAQAPQPTPPASKPPTAAAPPPPSATPPGQAPKPAGAQPAAAPAAAGAAPRLPRRASRRRSSRPRGSSPHRRWIPKIFDEALKDYFDNKQEQAARKLYSFIESTPPTDENFAWAQYFLARCLIDLNLRHAGAVYLAKVAHERSNPQVLPKTLEALKVLTQVPHDEVLIDEQIFGSLDLGFLPDSVSDYANYQQGLVDLRVGNERWARTHFVKLDDAGVEASRAKFALLVTRLRNAKGVVDDQMIDDFLELSKDEKLTMEARNEARLAVARLRYEKKDYEGALKAYDMVLLPSLDPGRATLYLEEAWTRYNLGQLRATIGLLTTLDAPSFRDEFLPDKYILRALVFRDLCQYLPAKRAAKELTRRFSDSLEAIRERDDLTQDFRLRRAANSHGSTKRAARFLTRSNLEGEQLGRLRRRLRRPALQAPPEGLRPGARRGRAPLPAAAPGGGARGGGQAAPRRRAGAADGVRGGPQALRAREARARSWSSPRRRAAHLRPGRLQVRRRVLERRASQLPGQHSSQPLHRGGRASDRALLPAAARCQASRAHAAHAGQEREPGRHQAAGEGRSTSRSSSGTSSRWTARIGRDRAADRQEPQRARTCPTSSSAWPSSTWRRAATCTSSRRSSAAESSKGADHQPGDQAAQAEGGAALQPPAARVPGLPRRRTRSPSTWRTSSASSVSSTRC